MRSAILFYSGTLISSIGSYVFNICLIAFMAKAGFDLFHVSLILGLQRLVPILITGVLGQYTDRVSPRQAVVALELGAAVASFRDALGLETRSRRLCVPARVYASQVLVRGFSAREQSKTDQAPCRPVVPVEFPSCDLVQQDNSRGHASRRARRVGQSFPIRISPWRSGSTSLLSLSTAHWSGFPRSRKNQSAKVNSPEIRSSLNSLIFTDTMDGRASAGSATRRLHDGNDLTHVAIRRRRQALGCGYSDGRLRFKRLAFRLHRSVA